MKHISSVVASLLASLFCLATAAAPALAQDNAQIVQGGSGNSVVIEQIGTAGNNHAVVQQADSWYGPNGGNHVQLMQRNVDNSRAEVSQSGFNNHYMVYQSDGTNLEARINMESGPYGAPGGDGNTIQVSQTGAHALASVEQSGSYFSRADIWQSGWNGQSMAEIRQAGDFNQAGIDQMGGNNQASIHQSGSNLNAFIVQSTHNGHGYGYGNNATIRQGH